MGDNKARSLRGLLRALSAGLLSATLAGQTGSTHPSTALEVPS